jgi:hypothetical protein
MRSSRYIFVVLLASVSLWGQSNPIPFVNQPLIPGSAAPGGSSFTLTVDGAGFVPDSAVNWNGKALTTHFVNQGQLTAAVSSNEISTAGAAAVTVVNPAPGGGASSPAWFEITAPTPGAGFFSASDYLSETVQAIASGDLNGDGIPDIAVAISCLTRENCNTGGVTILPGKGDGTFVTGKTYAAGLTPVWVTTADFNGDGKIDLAVLNSNCSFFNCPIGVISILLGNGDGTFQSAVNYNTGLAPVNMIAADLNGDGKLDLVTANNCGYSCNNGPAPGLSVLLGNGDGTFQPYVNYELTNTNNAIWVAAGDVNKDGKLDLVAVDYCANRQCSGGPSLVSILLGNGDGTFQAPSNVPTNDYPSALALADVNGDGNLDLLVAVGGLVIAGVSGQSLPAYPPELSNPGSVEVILGNGDGTFEKGQSYSTDSQPASIAVGDFNGDGILDVVTSNLGDLSATSGSVSILQGNGDGSFETNVDYFTGFAPLSVLVSDFNRDGRLDVAVGDQGSQVSVLLQTLVDISRPSVAFPTAILVGQSSTTQPVKITNIGTQVLHISKIAIGGTDLHEFAEQNSCGYQLEPQANCVVELNFTPILPGLRTAALTIFDDAAGGEQSIPLSGQGTIITFTPSSLSFGDEMVGTTGAGLTTTMTNTGQRSIRIFQSISIDGPDASDFKQTHTCKGHLTSGQNCTITVTFTPEAQGSRTAWITVYDDGGGSPQLIGLSGTGKAAK